MYERGERMVVYILRMSSGREDAVLGVYLNEVDAVAMLRSYRGEDADWNFESPCGWSLSVFDPDDYQSTHYDIEMHSVK